MDKTGVAASKKKQSFLYFTALFRFWYLQFTNPHKLGLLNLSKTFSKLKELPPTQEHMLLDNQL